MAVPRPPRNFVAWNSGSSLIPSTPPTMWDPILANALKALTKFSGEDCRTLVEHLQDVADVCMVHHVIEQNVALRLLVASFIGKVLD